LAWWGGELEGIPFLLFVVLMAWIGAWWVGLAKGGFVDWKEFSPFCLYSYLIFNRAKIPRKQI